MDTERQTAQQRYELVCPGLPLAVYREVAAHIRQVEGVDAGLTPQQIDHFDYFQSQVGNLWIQYSTDLNPVCQEQVEKILEYYGSRFGTWIRNFADNVVTG
jgi:uncharacterized protein YbjT (DUF2867 family)